MTGEIVVGVLIAVVGAPLIGLLSMITQGGALTLARMVTNAARSLAFLAPPGKRIVAASESYDLMYQLWDDLKREKSRQFIVLRATARSIWYIACFPLLWIDYLAVEAPVWWGCQRTKHVARASNSMRGVARLLTSFQWLSSFQWLAKFIAVSVWAFTVSSSAIGVASFAGAILRERHPAIVVTAIALTVLVGCGITWGLREHSRRTSRTVRADLVISRGPEIGPLVGFRRAKR